MPWVSKAWRAASRNQKIVIVVGALVVLGAIGNAFAAPAAPGPLTAVASPTPGAANGQPSSAAVGPTSSPASSPLPTNGTPGPTAHPTSKPTPKPTPKPTSAPSLTLSFSSLTSPVSPGSFATATVRTSAGAYCTIVVEYKSGPSTASGLGPKYASSSGVASWTWKVGSRTTAGSWPVTVGCSKGGLHKSVTKDFTVL